MAEKKQTSSKVKTTNKTNVVKAPSKEVKTKKAQSQKNNKTIDKKTTKKVKQKPVVESKNQQGVASSPVNMVEQSVATPNVQPQQQKPLYYDPATGQPVYSAQNPSGANMVNMAMYNAYSSGAEVEKTRAERKKKEQKVFGITAIILALCGLAVFGLGWVFMSFVFNVNNVDPALWFLIVVGWILGPFMIIVIPPILWLIGLIFGIVGVFKGPKRAVSWIGLVISIIAVVAGIFLLVSFGGSAFVS